MHEVAAVTEAPVRRSYAGFGSASNH